MKLNKNCIFLFLFCIVLYGAFLGTIPLLDPDEPVYGETAKEMIATGDFLSPRIYGEFWYDKPPLFYWLEALSFSLFGVSTWAARFPSLFLGALTPVYLYLSSRKLIGGKAALRGAFICATSLEIIVLARSSVTDTLLTLTLTIALMSFLRKEYIAAYIFCGLALLTKGPVGFGFPALIVGIWMVLTKQFHVKEILGLKWYWGIPLACLVGLPWYVAMGHIHGSAFIDTFLGYHNLTRFVSPEHAGQNHYWLYIVVLLAGFYPWSGTLPGIFRRTKKWLKDRTSAFFLVWTLFIFIFFSLSSTQLFSYVLPMFPPLSLLAGMYLTDCEESGHISKALIFSHLFFSLLTAGAIALAPIHPDGAPSSGGSSFSSWSLPPFWPPWASKGPFPHLHDDPGPSDTRLRSFHMGRLCLRRIFPLYLRRHCGEACQHRPGPVYPPLCGHLLPSLRCFLHRHLRKCAA